AQGNGYGVGRGGPGRGGADQGGCPGGGGGGGGARPGRVTGRWPARVAIGAGSSPSVSKAAAPPTSSPEHASQGRAERDAHRVPPQGQWAEDEGVRQVHGPGLQNVVLEPSLRTDPNTPPPVGRWPERSTVRT